MVVSKLARRVRRLRTRRRRRNRYRLVAREHQPDDSPIVRDDARDSDTLLLVLSGMNNKEVGDRNGPAGMGFEFLRLARNIPVKRMFVRDPYQAWYQRGLPDTEETLLGAHGLIKREVDDCAPQRLVVIGNSAGGYAALVFGTLLGADVVLSFSPQTTLDRRALKKIGDTRWEQRLKPLATHKLLDPDWIDVRRGIEAGGGARTRYRIFVDDAFQLDRWHAERLAGLDGLVLRRFGGRGAHLLVQNLRDSGALERVLREAIQTRHDPVAG